MGERFALVRDIRVEFESGSEVTDVSLHGRVVLEYSRSRNVYFYVLRDVTESIQLLVERKAVDEATLNSYVELKVGDVVEVFGNVGRSNSGKFTLFPRRPAKQLGLPEDAELIVDDISGVGTQIILARLEEGARSYFESKGYTELSPRYLSNRWINGGLQPLEVLFRGQSRAPLFLAVSPLPKLLTALFAVGHSSFFTVSKSFATNFIATQNGSESVVLGSVSIDMDNTQCADMALELIDRLLSSSGTSVTSDLADELAIPATKSYGHDFDLRKTPRGLHVHYAEGLDDIRGPGNFPVVKTFQISWRDEYYFAEGFTMALSKSLDANFVTVYIERLLGIIRMQDNRIIRNLLNPAREALRSVP